MINKLADSMPESIPGSRVLDRCIKTIRIAAWALIACGAYGLIFIAWSLLLKRQGLTVIHFFGDIHSVLFSYGAVGLILMLASELFAFTYKGDHKITWLLRHGDKILIAVACYMISKPLVLGLIWFPNWLSRNEMRATPMLFLNMIFAAAPSVAQCIATFSFALILRRVVPIVEESKTLA